MAGDTREIIVRIINGSGTGGKGGSSGVGSSKSVKELEAELNKVEKTTKNIFEQQKLLRNLYKKTATDTDTLSGKALTYKTALEKVNAKVREFNQSAKKGKSGWLTALNSYQFKFNALGNIIANVTSTITRGFVNAIKNVISISKEFEEQMSAVRAITRAMYPPSSQRCCPGLQRSQIYTQW